MKVHWNIKLFLLGLFYAVLLGSIVYGLIWMVAPSKSIYGHYTSDNFASFTVSETSDVVTYVNWSRDSKRKPNTESQKFKLTKQSNTEQFELAIIVPDDLPELSKISLQERYKPVRCSYVKSKKWHCVTFRFGREEPEVYSRLSGRWTTR